MERIGDKNKYYKKIMIFIIIIAMLFTLISYAVSEVTVKKIVENGVQYIYFELNHNIANVAYKYFGFGYHVTIYDNNNNKIGYKFLTNAEFSPKMIGGVETVKIPVEELYYKTDVETKYYYRQDCTIWLNGRLGIKVNGTLKFLYDSLEGTPEKGLDGLKTGYATYDGQTVPLNKDGYGIKNGINHEYNISWTLDTQINLKQHFGIHFTLDPIFKYDGFEVQYKEVATGKTVSSQKELQNFNKAKTITEYPETVNGYEYSGYYEIRKVDKIGNTTNLKPIMQGDSATVSLAQTSSVYTIIFYYNKVDLSTIENPVIIDIEYREGTSTGKQLIPSEQIISSKNSKININSKKIDKYICIGYYKMGQGQAIEYFYETNASFIVSKEDCIIFIFEEIPYVSIPKCSPYVDGDADTVNISMKKKDFENATDISVNNAVFKIENFKCGKDANGDDEEGTHEFNYFDLYIDKYKSSYDNKSKETTQSFLVPKNIFTQSTTDTNLYTANIDVTYAAFCTCFDGKPDSHGNYGMAIDNGNISVNITLIENKPPEAYFDYYTEKRLQDGSTDEIYRAYIGHETIISNQATDPNGITDIKELKYTLKDSNNKQYYVNLLMLGNGTYFLDDDNVNANNIVFQGVTDFGDLKLKFLTSETWTITQYVEDIEGLNDTYTRTVNTEVLNLRPIAVISDAPSYRYPVGTLFNGKQNRVVMFNSNNSYVANFLDGTGVSINHNRDTWEIVPLDGQSFDGIKFEKDTNSQIIDGVLQVKYIPLDNLKMMFKEKGRYMFRLQVSDTNGNVSEWAEQVITINEDLKPTITASVNAKYYRDINKNVSIAFNALATSNDYDTVIIESIGYKFDSNNDGNFNNETLQTANLTHKDVNIDGVIYKQIKLTDNRVGKYQFIIDVKEEFGQETIDKYIESKDCLTANINIITEVDNIAPTASLGLQKENNIDVKILTGGLTGTRNQDVQNNLSNLKNWLESENNIKVGNIEIVDMGKTINAMETGLTWRKVQMNGILSTAKFWYKEENGERIMLPTGVYAEGWNGIDIPKTFIWGENYFDKEDGYIKPNDSYQDVMVRNNFFDYIYGERLYGNRNQYKDLYVQMGNLKGSAWDRVLGEVDRFSMVTDQEIKDFDITFDFVHELRSFPGEPIEPHYVKEYLLFNVKDKNNYFALLHHELNDNNNVRLEQYYDYPWELIQVKSGTTKTLRKFSDSELKRRYKDDGSWVTDYFQIIRLVQKGNLIEVYSDQYGGKILYSGYIDDYRVGGRLGLGAQEGQYHGLGLKSLRLDIKNLSYIENASVYDSLNQLNWRENSDKYIINMVEGTKVEELVNSLQLNKTAAKLQAEEITLINVGVNSVNGTKLKEITTKNQNNGTYIEIGNVYNNLNSSATYIRNKYTGQTTADEYMLLGDTIKYLENYSDVENDTVFSKEYKLNHLYTYFENNLGVIGNNNVWQDNIIETFNKTGKYTLNYRVKDNPLYPDLNVESLFKDYRKYSSIYEKNIFVHRKPIPSFAIDKSFKDNALIKTTLTLKNLNRIYPYVNSDRQEYTNADVNLESNVINMQPRYISLTTCIDYALFEIDIPSDAINPIMMYHSENTRYKSNGGKTVTEEDIKVDISTGKIQKEFSLSGTYNGTYEYITDFKIEFYQPNPNIHVNITENSYDIDHKSLSSKGITEWQWKIVDENGVTTAYNTTNRATGITWIQNTLSTNQKWKNASVQLRVKDMEGIYSNWAENYIDEGVIFDPVITEPEITQKKPVADFIINKNPLKLGSDIQNIFDNSYDPEGFALTYVWNVKKIDKQLFTNVQKNIDTQLNQEVIKNGVGTYEISLTVTNTKGVQSNTVTKSFDVVVYNDEPTVNFNLVSNENPTWIFPKTLGLYTLRYRPSNTLFSEEYTRFDTYINDPNTDNTGFIYNWKLERFAVKDISNISGTATNTYNYITQFPFTNSFKNQGLSWGAYKITFKVTDIPPIPPYQSTDAKSSEITKYYYIVPEISLDGSFESSKSEIMVGDTIKLKSTTSKLVESVNCTFDGTTYILSKISENGSSINWEKNITIPESITESGTYQLQFVGKTTYGGNGNVTREVKDTATINIVALKLINFRITNIVNHPFITFPYTKDMLIANLIPYKTGYYVTFLIDSKGKPDFVYGRIDIGNNGTIDQNINLTKVVTGDTETWQGRFYTSTFLPTNTVISIKLDCNKGATTYSYNEKENWDGKSLIINGSALQDGRINLTN